MFVLSEVEQSQLSLCTSQPRAWLQWLQQRQGIETLIYRKGSNIECPIVPDFSDAFISISDTYTLHAWLVAHLALAQVEHISTSSILANP